MSFESIMPSFVMWKNSSTLQMLLDLPTYSTYRNLKFLHITDFSPLIRLGILVTYMRYGKKNHQVLVNRLHFWARWGRVDMGPKLAAKEIRAKESKVVQSWVGTFIFSYDGASGGEKWNGIETRPRNIAADDIIRLLAFRIYLSTNNLNKKNVEN